VPDDDVDDVPDQDDDAAEGTPDQDPDVEEADEQSANRIRLSDILKAAEGENDRELTDEEAEAVRAAGERLRVMLSKYVDPPWMKSFAKLGRITQFSAGNKFFQMPEIGRMTTLAKGLSRSPVTKFLATSAEPSWMKSLKVVDSDLYRNLGLGQSNLNLLGSHLVRNADFGFDARVGKFASLWAGQQSSVLARLGTLAKSLTVGFYPPNLNAIENLGIENVEEVVMIDGIALYAVPRTAIAEKLINAQTTAERRATLGSRWGAISADCRTAIEGCTSDGVTEYAPFVLSALDALDANNAPAAQALATSVIDTVITRHFGNDRMKYTPGRKTTTPHAYEDFTMRQWIAFAPLWQAYQQYHANNGDPIPKTFSRHASVHGVSSRQFSRRNAVQGLMFLTGVLVFLDEQAAKAQAA
jgi:hypothetical protein